jgi:predicted ArsR family transcriptional regulator
MAIDARAPAREKLLFQLKLHGPQTAAELAGRLGVTEVASRQHLSRLLDEALVSYEERPGGVGRPARRYAMTEAASGRFPDTHAELTVDLLEAARHIFGEEGVGRLVADRTKRQLESYRARLPRASAPLSARVTALAALRAEEGYMAQVEAAADGSFLLLENHCPICAAARVCQGLCRDELALFRRVLGSDTRVERTEHALAGSRRCAYRIASARAPAVRTVGRRRS